MFVPAVSLPDLTVVNQVKDDFQIGLLSEVSYPEAAKLAATSLWVRIFTFSNDRYNITITSMDLYGQNDNLIIKAGLKGTISGDIYLRGRPYYDAQTQTISLKDITYDLETENLLQRSASWLSAGNVCPNAGEAADHPSGILPGRYAETAAGAAKKQSAGQRRND
jgi:hypothetical protein